MKNKSRFIRIVVFVLSIISIIIINPFRRSVSDGLFSKDIACHNCVVVLADDDDYTPEEKAQAKAWLSAHGYPPTRAGASAAYQDYLDGKFDDELGLNDDDEEETTEARITTSADLNRLIQAAKASETDATETDASETDATESDAEEASLTDASDGDASIASLGNSTLSSSDLLKGMEEDEGPSKRQKDTVTNVLIIVLGTVFIVVFAYVVRINNKKNN